MTKILLVGCGKMGGALLRGWQKSPVFEVAVVDPSPVASVPLCVPEPSALPASFVPDVVVLAVKPQSMATVLPVYAVYTKALFLSIAAGQSLATLERLLGLAAPALVRAMPNLPASIGAGVSAMTATAHVTPAQKALAERLLLAVGPAYWVKNETQIDAVTALSGSGPAYVFALVEAMAAAGVKLGLPEDLASALARQTVIGSGALLAQSTESAEVLRRAVTSPSGTTAAALVSLLGENGLPDLMFRAMSAAATRARELAG